MREKHKCPLPDGVYDEIVEYLKGKKNKPVKHRETKNRSAYNRLYGKEKELCTEKRRDVVSGKDTDRIILKGNGRAVVKVSEVPIIIDFFYDKHKGIGAKKLVVLIGEHYTGIGEKVIQTHLNKKIKHRSLHTRFLNKSPLIPITASCTQERHQLDLADFSKYPTSKGDLTFKYVLSVLDVFSRFLWLRPLTEKSDYAVAEQLKAIYLEYGPPKIIQTDQGGEFKGAVRQLSNDLGINMIRSSSRHPQSQGKIERSHGTWKSKLASDVVDNGYKDVDWAAKLPEYASLYNNEVHSAFGRKHCPFHIYFGRKSNTKSIISKHPHVEEVKESPNMSFPDLAEMEIDIAAVKILDVQTKAQKLSEEAADRMVRAQLAQQPPVKYDIGQSVLVRLKSAKRKKDGGRLKRATFTTQATVIDFNKNKQLYKIMRARENCCEGEEWVSVRDISSRTTEEELTRQQCAMGQNSDEGLLEMDAVNCLQYFTVFDTTQTTSKSESALDVLSELIYSDGMVVENVTSDGNCMFSAISHKLELNSVNLSPYILRQMAVAYLSMNPNMTDGTPLVSFIEGRNWKTYLRRMKKDGEWGDHLMLMALAEVLRREIKVTSGNQVFHHVTINPVNAETNVNALHLGHIAEVHYVSLVQRNVNYCTQQIAGEEIEQDAFWRSGSNAHSPLPSGLSRKPYGPLRDHIPKEFQDYVSSEMLDLCLKMSR